MSINSNKEEGVRGEVVQLRRIADAMEEILRLVKVDQAKTEKSMNGMSEEPSHTHEKIVELTK